MVRPVSPRPSLRPVSLRFAADRDRSVRIVSLVSLVLGLGLALFLGLVMVPAAPAVAQEAGEAGAEPEATFQGETTVIEVSVPVQVIDDGDPVRGLTRENFVVVDGGEERPITSFEVLDLGPERRRDAPAVSDAALRQGRRHFLVLIDMAFTERNGVQRSLRAAERLIDDQMGDEDLAAIALYTDRNGLVMPLPFTNDRDALTTLLDALEAALDGVDDETVQQRMARFEAGRGDGIPGQVFGGPNLPPEVGAAAGMGSSPASEALAAGAGAAGGGGRRGGGAAMIETLADMAALAQDATRSLRRSQVRSMMEIFAALAERTEAIPGRKIMAFFSSGFPSYVYGADVLRMSPGSSRTLAEIEGSMEAMRRAGWTIHAIEPTAGADTTFAGDRTGSGGLFLLADETGGELYRNFADPRDAVEEMLERTSVTYLLTFQSPELRTDGAWRPVEVRLEGVGGNPRVSHRSGYNAPGGAAGGEGLEGSQQILATRTYDDLGARLVALPLPAEAGLTRVPVVVEVEGRRLLEARDGAAEAGGSAGGAEGSAEAGEGERVGVEVIVHALDAGSGQLVDLVAQDLSLDAAALGEQLSEGELVFYGDLLVPEGSYVLRTLVRERASGQATVSLTPLEAPAWSEGRLLPPVFAQPDEPRVLVREPGSEATPYPFWIGAGEETYVPVSRPLLSGGESRRVVLMGFGLDTGSVQLAGRVLDPSGAPVQGGRVQFVDRSATEDGRQTFVVEFAPGDLAAGEYQLALALIDPESGTVVGSSASPFRVAGR